MLSAQLPETPIACPFPEVLLADLKGTTRMRRSRGGPPPTIVTSAPEGAVLQQMVGFGNAMLQHMNMMSQAIAAMQGKPVVPLPAPSFTGAPGQPPLLFLQPATPAAPLALPSTPATSDAADRLAQPALLAASPVSEDDAPVPPAKKLRSPKSVADATAEIAKALDEKSGKQAAPKKAPKAKAKCKAEATARATPKGQAKAAPKKGAKLVVTVNHERSRTQFLVRVPGASSKIFRYAQGGAAAAEKAARSWAKSRSDELGLPRP